MSKHQVVHNMKIEGGFLGMHNGLAAKALPFLAKTALPTLATGALSGVGSVLAQKATNNAVKNGLYLKKVQISQGLKPMGKVCIGNHKKAQGLEMWEVTFMSNKVDNHFSGQIVLLCQIHR